MRSLMTDDPSVRYCVYQEERGENGVRHYQGYVELSAPQRMSYMKKLLPRAHWEKRKRTRDECRNYCMKEDTRIAGPFEIGEWQRHQGARTDLSAAIATAKTTLNIAQVAKDHPVEFVKFNRGLQALIFHTRPERDLNDPPQVCLKLHLGTRVGTNRNILGPSLLRWHRHWKDQEGLC